jgi:hypothetical protein
MKYLRPIFTELVKLDASAAARIYAEARESHHHIARSVIEGLLTSAAASG